MLLQLWREDMISRGFKSTNQRQAIGKERGIGEWEWEWGMGNGEWGMGNGEWGMGNGERETGNRERERGIFKSRNL